mmetsp:Transcript_93663/g.214244  ORF Transcript_93663/g.214244 Transcript_93663/m.214244 type:complete len:402 (-) Transcript_93663:211-1416(-)
MYGDVGHGLVLSLFGMRLCYASAEPKESLLGSLFFARYLFVLMGFFSVYAGLMYSDFLSVGLNLFGSSYSEVPQTPQQEKDGITEFQLNGAPYPFGLDPAWHGSQNELLFVNSLKMKLSVLFGVAQMFLGNCLKIANSINGRNPIDLFFEAIPQTLFLLCFFGYMDWMIMYKWVLPIEQMPASDRPSILNTMITMFMAQDNKQPLYDGQDGFQNILLLILVCCVPMMLIPKPILLWQAFQRKQLAAQVRRAQFDDLELQEYGNAESETLSAELSEEFDAGEIVIHQLIETIEYVLGTVSHTASYLRLWALSLAHGQLAGVILQKILLPAFAVPLPWNGLAIFCAFPLFALATTGILCFMDVLECFLHALRLHWVEFQSKFYHADGKEFAPFRLATVLADHD